MRVPCPGERGLCALAIRGCGRVGFDQIRRAGPASPRPSRGLHGDMLSATAPELEERIEFLRRPGLWGGLPEEALREVAGALQPARFASGQVIIARGEPGRHLHVLTSGRVEVRVKSDGGAVVPVAVFRTGDSFGEMSLLTGDVTSADVIAVEDCESLVLEREAFDTLTTAHPHLLRDLVRVISRRLRETDSAVGSARDMTDVVARLLNDASSEPYGELIGKNRDIHDLRKQIVVLAEVDDPLLIEGEEGTGKELVARQIHLKSRRKDAPFLSVHCKQVSESRSGDSLFGGDAASPGNSFMHVAQGGTLLLKNIEDLPPAVQDRLADALAAGGACRGVRVMVTCRTALSDLATAGRVSSVLAATLSRSVLRTTPLRGRKRDIPELAAYFAARHAKRLAKSVSGLDDQTVVKLVSYDFRIGNVRELEEAIERAVVLTGDATIDAEEVFLGPPPRAQAGGFNLLGILRPLIRLGPRVFPGALTATAVVALSYILYGCLFDPGSAKGILATRFAWSLGWPALVLSFFFVGRVCCAICPMAFAGGTVQRLRKREGRIPGWVKKYDAWITLAGFFAIVWAEEVTSMRTSPRATGILLLAILGGAVLSGLLFPRRTWCRHLCPLGGLAGVCSSSSMLELRPSLDVCTAKCKDHSCYKGDEHTPGCPMFNHVMFVESNQQCVFCLNCVRSCPNGSPQLNLRMPARELWTNLTARPEVGRFVAMLAGLVVAVTLIHLWEKASAGALAQLVEMDRMILVSGLLLCSAGIPLLTLWLAPRRAGEEALVWQRVAAWVPLVGAGFTAYQVAYLPGIDTLRATLAYRPDAVLHAMTISVGALVQCIIITVGLAITLVTIWKDHGGGADAETGRLRARAGRLAGAVAYWAILLVLIVQPSFIHW